MAFDREGSVWIACIFGNAIIRLAPGGTRTTWLSAPDQAYVDEVERAFAADELSAVPIGSPGRSPLHNVSSLDPGGPDHRTAYMGSLQGSRVLAFRSPFSGAPRT